MGGEGHAGLSQCSNRPFSRLKPIQKMEGMTNGVAVGPQQATGLSDISAQVQQYQQFLGESALAHGVGSGPGSGASGESGGGSSAFPGLPHSPLPVGDPRLGGKL